MHNRTTVPLLLARLVSTVIFCARTFAVAASKGTRGCAIEVRRARYVILLSEAVDAREDGRSPVSAKGKWRYTLFALQSTLHSVNVRI